MNKILYLAALLALSSCDGGKVAVYKEGPEGATCEWIERSGNPFDYVHHFSYHGHDYIYFSKGSGHGCTAAVSHDPDCKCKEDKK